jgi:hypothetical protein
MTYLEQDSFMLVVVVRVLTMPFLVVLVVLAVEVAVDLLHPQVVQGVQMELQTAVTVVLDLLQLVVQVEQILAVAVAVVLAVVLERVVLAVLGSLFFAIPLRRHQV